MRKFVWVPVVSLGGQAKGEYFEIMSEPARFGGANMDAIKNCGFDKNIAQSQELLKRLQHQPGAVNLYLTGNLANVSNTPSVNLGLIVASFMHKATCPYQKLIITGQLDTAQAQFLITEAPGFEDRIAAVLHLGKQPQPIPFFLPRTMLTTCNSALLSQVEAKNIEIKPIDDLFDVLLDFGIA